MVDPYRTNEETSEVEKVARLAEREMMELFARLLSETNPHEISRIVTRLDRLAHERALALRIEAQRRMYDWKPRSFVVNADGLIVEVDGIAANNADEEQIAAKYKALFAMSAKETDIVTDRVRRQTIESCIALLRLRGQGYDADSAEMLRSYLLRGAAKGGGQ